VLSCWPSLLYTSLSWRWLVFPKCTILGHLHL
jgi:hypothetical protein